MAITDNTKWSGSVSAITLLDGHLLLVFGSIRRLSSDKPTWGEVIGTFANYKTKRPYPIQAYGDNGEILNSIVLTSDGKLSVYSPDYAKLESGNRMYHINLAAYID